MTEKEKSKSKEVNATDPRRDPMQGLDTIRKSDDGRTLEFTNKGKKKDK